MSGNKRSIKIKKKNDHPLSSGRPSKIKIWIMVLRPRTLWASVCPVLMAGLIAYRADVLVKNAWGRGICVLLGGVILQALTNVINDYWDYKKGVDTADRIGPLRILQANLMTEREMKIGILILMMLSVGIGIVLTVLGSSPLIWGVLGLCLFLSYAYTGGKYAISYVGLGDVFAFCFFGPVATVVTTWLLTDRWIGFSLILGVVCGSFAVAMLSVNNLRDREEDGRAGKKTLAVRFGESFIKMEYVLFVVLACCLIPFWAVVQGEWYYVLPGLTLLYLFSGLKGVLFGEKSILNRALTRTSEGQLLYTFFFMLSVLLERFL